MTESLKTLLKVIALGLTPLGLAILLAANVTNDEDIQLQIVFVGGLISFGVLLWIYICWGDDDGAAD